MEVIYDDVTPPLAWTMARERCRKLPDKTRFAIRSSLIRPTCLSQRSRYLEWKTCQRLLGSAWSHSSVVRALLMTSRVPGSSPGGSGVFFSFQAVHFPDWSFEFEVLPILSKFNHFLSPLVVSRNWPWLVPWGREKDPSAISMCGTCCELPLEWKTE